MQEAISDAVSDSTERAKELAAKCCGVAARWGSDV